MVVISGRREREGALAVEEIRAAASTGSDGAAHFIQNDVTNEAEVSRMIDAIASRHGRLDMAVNNAGVSTENKIVSDSDTAAFKAMLDSGARQLSTSRVEIAPSIDALAHPCDTTPERRSPGAPRDDRGSFSTGGRPF